jgi:predicted Zn-dependent protease
MAQYRSSKITGLLALLVLALLSGCYKNSITGKNQLSLVSEAEVQAIALTEFNHFIATNQVVDATSKNAKLVATVGARIAEAVTQYYTQKGLSNVFAGYRWEYKLIDSPEINAWCMPGGKIVVYTGLLPVTQNEDGLAVVLGHEIAHALARHGNQRISEGLVQQMGGIALSVAVANKPLETRQLFQTAYGVGTEVGVMLPHSRSQETEADKFGLRFAAMAGYNIREAIPFWTRMRAMGSGQQVPVFLSTHPSDEQRISRLNKIMEQTIKEYYKPYNK